MDYELCGRRPHTIRLMGRHLKLFLGSITPEMAALEQIVIEALRALRHVLCKSRAPVRSPATRSCHAPSTVRGSKLVVNRHLASNQCVSIRTSADFFSWLELVRSGIILGIGGFPAMNPRNSLLVLALTGREFEGQSTFPFTDSKTLNRFQYCAIASCA